MIDQRLIEYMQEALKTTPTVFHRYMYDNVLWDDRMFGIIGPRGIGKSTMVKQYILQQANPADWLYVSADHIYFSEHSLSGLASDMVKENMHHLVVDEIHRYPGWSTELKMIYDIYPSLQIIFTGSSILDIRKGCADLSRRVLIFEMQGLSFREYLRLFKDIILPVYSLDDILSGKTTFPCDFHPLPLFREYLRNGYYPFGKLAGYELRLQQVISQTIEGDIPQFAGMSIAVARKLKRLLTIVAGLAPFKPSVLNLSAELKVSKNDVPDYLMYLEMSGMIGQLRDDTGGLRGLGKVEKVYVDNTNLMYALADKEPNSGNMRETFFYNQTRVKYDVMSSKISDFRIGDCTFEVGGASKGTRQLKGADKGYVVRDDIELATREFIPLWQFGLTY